MWNLLTRRKVECNQMQDLLEAAAARHPLAASVEEFLEGLPQAQRRHFAECGSCREAVQDLFATRKLFEGIASHTEGAGPWFSRRVMAAIATRERELALRVSPWTAVPRFASRLAWATAIVLLVGSTWLYERPAPVAKKQPAAVASPEYLFEAPVPPMNRDDVLISMAERNP